MNIVSFSIWGMKKELQFPYSRSGICLENQSAHCYSIERGMLGPSTWRIPRINRVDKYWLFKTVPAIPDNIGPRESSALFKSGRPRVKVSEMMCM